MAEGGTATVLEAPEGQTAGQAGVGPARLLGWGQGVCREWAPGTALYVHDFHMDGVSGLNPRPGEFPNFWKFLWPFSCE